MATIFRILRWLPDKEVWENIGEVETDVYSNTVALKKAEKNPELLHKMEGYSVTAQCIVLDGHVIRR